MDNEAKVSLSIFSFRRKIYAEMLAYFFNH